MTDDITDTDKKRMFSDHDLLVRVNTILDYMVEQNRDFLTQYKADQKDIVQRVTALEVKQSAHLKATEINTDDIASLQKRSNWFDAINAAATAVVAAIMLFLRGK